MKPIKPLQPLAPSAIERLRKNNIIQAWLVLILAACFGSALAGVHITLSPTIAQNKINETLEKVPELVLGPEMAPDAELDVASEIVPVEKAGRKTFYNVYKASMPDGKPAGWVVKTKGQGYADRIELLVGLGPKADRITGLFILDQKETPGLGAKITDAEWRSQFTDKKTTAPLTAVKDGANAAGEIDAITGATISSRSVCGIINTAVADLKGRLSEKIN